jgi:hypothetical protein
MLIERIHGAFPVAECTLTDGTRVEMGSIKYGLFPLLTSMDDCRLSVAFSQVRLGRLYGSLLFAAVNVVGFLLNLAGGKEKQRSPVALFKFAPGSPVAGVWLVSPQSFRMVVLRGRMESQCPTLMLPVDDLYVLNSMSLKLASVLNDAPAIEAIGRGLSDSSSSVD